MAAATALTSGPFFLSCRRCCCALLPTITAAVPRGRLINIHHGCGSISISNVGKFTPSLLPRYPPRITILHNTIDNSSPSSTRGGGGRRRKGSQLVCYCTEVETEAAKNNNNTTGLDEDGEEEEEDKYNAAAAVREAANTLDIRVGRILKAWRHEEADSLYIEEVDVGEPEPRTICSGLVKYIPLHLLQDRNVIVLANLKPRSMRGVKSFGMLMAASDAAHENVELLAPPEGAVPGDRVWFGSADEKENLPDVASPNQVQKKKIWELVQPHLRTDDSCVATLGKNHQMRTSAGVINSQSLKNANIS